MKNQTISEIQKTDFYQHNDNEKYSVLNYMEKHNTLFVACISALFAILSIYANILAYVYQSLKLQGWNVSTEIVDIFSGEQLFYNIVVFLIYYIANALMVHYLSNVFFQFREDMKISSISKDVCNELEKQISETENTIDEFEIHGDTHSEELHKRLKEARDSLEKVEKKIKEILGRCIKSVLSVVLRVALMFFPVSIFFHTITGTRFMVSIISSIVCIVVLLISSLIIAIISKPMLNPKLIIDEARKEESPEDAIRKRDAMVESLNPKGRALLSDSRIKYYAIVMLVLIISTAFAIIIMGMTAVINQKRFWIYSDSHKLYAVVYQNKEVLVLKEAEIEGEDITINIDKQRVIKNEDVELEYYKYSNVVRSSDVNDEE